MIELYRKRLFFYLYLALTGEDIVALNFLGKQSEKYTDIIGNHFLKNFIVAFNFDDNKVYLKPNAERVKILSKKRLEFSE